MIFRLLDQGAQYKEKIFLNQIAQNQLALRLYTNNRAPQCPDQFNAYTECTLPGYATLNFVPANWVLVVGGCICTGTYPLVTFNFGANAGGVTIFGAMITPQLFNDIYYAGLLDAPYNVPPAGGQLQFTCVVQQS